MIAQEEIAMLGPCGGASAKDLTNICILQDDRVDNTKSSTDEKVVMKNEIIGSFVQYLTDYI